MVRARVATARSLSGESRVPLERSLNWADAGPQVPFLPQACRSIAYRCLIAAGSTGTRSVRSLAPQSADRTLTLREFSLQALDIRQKGLKGFHRMIVIL